MNQAKSKKTLILTAMLIISLMCSMVATLDFAKAASGKVGGCTINRDYRHPVTGVIEDSGGEGSFATGQGMVESCAYNIGMIEETDNGQCYVTVRLTLMDMTENVAFKSQTRGGSGWSNLGTSVTQVGSDSSGETKDYCIKVPSRNCVIRCTMYVIPMGRDVVYYLSPSGFNEGNRNGMVATHVTSASNKGGSSNSNGGGQNNNSSSSNQTQGQVTAPQTKAEKAQAIKDVEEKIDAIGKVTIKKENLINEAREAYDNLPKELRHDVENYKVLKKAERELQTIKARELEKPNVESSLNTAKGLTLSTEKPVATESTNTAAIVLGVIALVAAAGGGGYYLVKRKQKGAGDTRDDDQ